jgi:hypothetical protein
MSNKVNITAHVYKPSKVYHPDSFRQCADQDCTIRLSMYNSTDYCSTHERQYKNLYVYKD